MSWWWEQVKFRQVDDDLYIWSSSTCIITSWWWPVHLCHHGETSYHHDDKLMIINCLNITCSHHDDTDVQVIINLSKFNLFSPWWHRCTGHHQLVLLFTMMTQMYRSSSTCLNITCSHHDDTDVQVIINLSKSTCSHHDDTDVQVIINLSKYNLFSPWWHRCTGHHHLV